MFNFQLEWEFNGDASTRKSENFYITQGQENATKALQDTLNAPLKGLSGLVSVGTVAGSSVYMSFNANISRVALLVEKQCRKREDKKTDPTVVLTNFTCPCPTSKNCQVPISAASAPNSFGFSDDVQKKSNFQILIGAAALDANIDLSGSAKVSANVGNVIEVEADLSASLGADMALSINRNGPLMSINEWLIQVKNITDPDIE
eukprot:7739968-Ditylum_brightwellii.AAC.1